MEKPIETPSKHPPQATGVPSVLKYVAAGLVAIVFGIGGFLGGMQYQKVVDQNDRNSATSTTRGNSGSESFLPNRGGESGGFGGMRRTGSFGTVSDVSSSSLTITQNNPQSSDTSGTSKTYSITSDTRITNGRESASASDIQKGDRVMVRTSSTDSSVATAITIMSTGM